jgi:hypothetical protein
MCFLHTPLYGGLTYKPKYMTIKSKTSKNAQTAVCLPSETLVEILSTQWHGFVNTMGTESTVNSTGTDNRCQDLDTAVSTKTFSHDTDPSWDNRRQPPEAQRSRSRTKTRTPTPSLGKQQQGRSRHNLIVMVTKTIMKRESTSSLSNIDNGPIMVGYSKEQDGQPIGEDKIVRARNGKYFGPDEPYRFKDKSRAGCPTYGNCTKCFESGPMNMRCRICDDDKHGHGHGILRFPHPYRQGDMRIVDAENWARIMGQEKTHVVALADRRITWIREPDHGQVNADELMSLSP